MMARTKCLLTLLILLSIIIACTPQSRQAGSPPALIPSQSTPSAIPTPNLPLPTSEDTAWAKVVNAARKEGTLTIYGSAQVAGELGVAISKAFKDRYGISVEILVGPGRQTVERAQVESRLNLPVGDVVFSGIGSATELSAAKLAAKVWPDLPTFKDTKAFIADPRFDPEGVILLFTMGMAGPLINTRLIKPEDEPRSYLDFLDPKWKKKIIVEQPYGGGGGGFTWFSTMKALKVLDDDYFRRFAANEPAIWGGSPVESYKLIARGEYAFGPYATTDSVGYLIVEGAPLKLLGMKEGNIARGNALVVLKTTPHPNVARLFADWMFSAEGQTVYSKAGAITSVRKDVPDFLDPAVRIKPEPGKILMRSWDVTEEGNRIEKSGIAETIFGKK